MKNKTSFAITPALAVLYLFSFMCGGFHEYISALLCVVLSVILISRIIKNKSVQFSLSFVNIILLLFPFLYLLSSLWAADTGIALLGFIKFLPLTLFTLILSDSEDDKNNILRILPYVGVFQTLISSLLMQITPIRSYFSVSGRLSGFFQYPNTFALFLLLGIIVIVTENQLRPLDFVCVAVLIFGILYSGSRTTAVLTVFFVLTALLTSKSRKNRRIILLLLAITVVLAGIYAFVSGNYSSIGRFLKMSFSESTLLGRFLYWKDGLRILASKPCGLGYLGWSYAQFSNQTGVYAVQFIHNEFLQIMLDVGIPGGILFIASIIAAFFSKTADRRSRLLILAFCGHMFMDFDLQFISVFLLFAVILYTPGKKKFNITGKSIIAVPCSVLSVFSVWLGLSQALYHFKKYDASVAVYKFNTYAQTKMIENSGINKNAVETADKVLKRNIYVSSAYAVKAASAFYDGDYKAMSEYKLQQIKCEPYNIALYDEYCDMLAVGFGMCKKQKDFNGMRFCRDEMLKIPEMLEELKKRTDSLAYKIDDKPSFEPNEKTNSYISMIQEVEIP